MLRKLACSTLSLNSPSCIRNWRDVRIRLAHGIDRIFSNFITGASYHELYCFEPQTTVGALTISFLGKDT